MKEKIMEVMSLCYDVTENTKHDAFFNFSAHVKWVTVEIHEGGWVGDADPNYRKDVYLNSKHNNPLKELNALIAKLSRYLED